MAALAWEPAVLERESTLEELMSTAPMASMAVQSTTAR
jgi:hypothetical protein